MDAKFPESETKPTSLFLQIERFMTTEQRFIPVTFHPTSKPVRPPALPTSEQKEHLKLWVKALRSDEYKQGKYCLIDGNRYCCLGVAAAVYSKNTDKPLESLVNLDRDPTAMLPSDIAEYFGLTNMTTAELPPGLPYNDMIKNIMLTGILVKLNDGLSYSFKEIADLIEKDYINKEWNDDELLTSEQADKVFQVQTESIQKFGTMGS